MQYDPSIIQAQQPSWSCHVHTSHDTMRPGAKKMAVAAKKMAVAWIKNFEFF